MGCARPPYSRLPLRHRLPGHAKHLRDVGLPDTKGFAGQAGPAGFEGCDGAHGEGEIGGTHMKIVVASRTAISAQQALVRVEFLI